MMDSININIYIKKYILPYLSSSSEQRLNELGIRNIFLGVDNTSFLLTIKKPNGVIESHRLTRGDNQDDWYPVTKKTLFFSAVSKNICQIKIENFSDNRLADSINFYHRQLSQSAGIIVDIRGNSGGSSILASKIASYLIQDSVFLGSKVATRKNLAVNRAYGLRYPVSDTIYEYKKNDILFAKNLILENLGTSITQNIIDQKEKIIKPVVVLIDAQNISAAEEFLVYLNKQDNVTLIGEPTGGGNGLPMIIQLPDGGSASICTQYCAFPDGSDYYRNGIQPQIVVNQTFTDFLFGIDTVMEAAIKFLSYKINH